MDGPLGVNHIIFEMEALYKGTRWRTKTNWRLILPYKSKSVFEWCVLSKYRQDGLRTIWINYLNFFTHQTTDNGTRRHIHSTIERTNPRNSTIVWLKMGDKRFQQNSKAVQVIRCQIKIFCHQLIQNMTTDFVTFTKICTNCFEI